MSIQTYQVRVKDLSGAVVAIFAGAGRGGLQGDLRSFTYLRRLRSLGLFTLYINGEDERLEHLKTINGQVEIWRRDPLAGLTWLSDLDDWRRDSRTLATGWYLDFEGFIRAWNRGFTAEGQRLFVCQGRQYNDMLAGETVNYPKGSAGASKTGLPGAIAAEYVHENIGAGAGVDGEGNTRVRAGVTEVVDGDGAVNWSGDLGNLNLLDALDRLAEFAPADFMLHGNGPAAFQFRWRHTRWGRDLTPGNPVGNIPVVFSVRNNNITQVRDGLNALDETNVVYVAGQGQGELRTYRTRSTPAARAFDWSRRAVFRDARDTNDLARLDARGDASLEEGRARYTASFNVVQTVATRYGRDWDLGDLTRFVDEDGTPTDLKVRGVRVSMDDNGTETIAPELEEEA